MRRVSQVAAQLLGAARSYHTGSAAGRSSRQWLLQRQCTPSWASSARPMSGLWRGFADLPAHTEMGMPSLSPTMTQGNIASWKKKEGDSIAPGDVLAEIETDKATMEWEAQEEGFLAKILKPAGSKDISVGEPVAVMVEDEGDLGAFKDYSPSSGGAKSSEPAEPAPSEQPADPAAAKSKPAESSGSSFPAHQMLNMPALSPTMTQGNIATWHKKVGDAVAPGDVLCDVETDKATMAWESQEEGFLAAILVPDGAKDVAVGAPAAVIVEEEELVPKFANFTAEDAAGAPAPQPPASSPPPRPNPAKQPEAQPKAAPAPAAPKPSAVQQGDRVVATPYAKKLAAEAGVSLEGQTGSGPNGRIVSADIQRLKESDGAKPAAKQPAKAQPGAQQPQQPQQQGLEEAGGWTDEALSNIKRVTAQRLLESKQKIPHYYLTMECQVDRLNELRAQLNAALAPQGTKLSVNDFIVKAAALALRKVPAVNASWMSDFVRRYHNVDVTVAVQTPAGLMVPFVRDADRKGLAAISTEVRALAGKAKDGKLQPSDYVGGTFTISNLGMYGIKQFAAIVNPPQAAILAVGAAAKKVVKEEGEFKEVNAMLVTLSCDHRVVDGAVGAEWLQAFKSYVENPLTMLV